MKAILLAGGEGTRLRPVTVRRPKPMVPLLGRPVLEHLLLLLRRHGISEAAVTLGYLPEQVERYFGDGSRWGMKLTYFREETPLGTAGAVKACQAFLGGEDCLVLSGDCVCDFDLTACAERHRQRGAEATLLLHRTERPLEYGLVLTDPAGRVTRFVEKPDWGQVCTDQVNTGIYLLRSALLDEIPEGVPCDFGRELFPRLLERGRALYGDLPRGYWRDMGDPGAYLAALTDALEGRVSLELTHPQLRDRLWSGSLLPEDALILPPCWIGSGVTLGRDCLIGPYAVLEDGTRVGDGAVLQRSALLGCQAGDRCTACGAILCPGARTEPEALLNEYSVLGDDAVLGRNAVLQPYAGVWPELTVPDGAMVSASLVSRGDLGRICFDEDGLLRGTREQGITAPLLLRLGSLLAEEGKCALGWSGGTAAQALALAAAGGIASGGGEVLLLDAKVPAAAAWCAGARALPVTLFLQQREETMSLYLFDRCGLSLSRPRQRRLERRLLRGESGQARAGQAGGQRRLEGTDARCAEAAARAGAEHPLPSRTAAVPERGAEAELLADSLSRLGCRVLRQETPGEVSAYSRRGGLELALRTERGRLLGPELVRLLTVLVLLEQGERTLALSPSAPALADRLAGQYGARLLRLGRDGAAAAEQARRLLPLRHGGAAACRIFAYLAETGQTLEQLLAKLPPIALFDRELPLEVSRGEAMERVSRAFPQSESMGDGVRVPLGGGWVWLTPMARRSALRLRAEAASPEFAEELCEIISEKVKKSPPL